MSTAAVQERAVKLLEQEKNRLVKLKKEIGEKYPHAITDSLVRDDATGKFKCRIKCVECGDTSRWVFTSDLHQVTVCAKCAEKIKAAKKNLRKEQNKLAVQMIREGKIVIKDGVAVAVAPTPKGWDKVETSTEETAAPEAAAVETPLVTAEAVETAEKKRRGRKPKAK